MRMLRAPIGSESSEPFKERILTFLRVFTTEAPYVVHEVVAAGLSMSIGFQLARDVESLAAGPAGAVLASRMSEPGWSGLCILAGALPIVGFFGRFAFLRWFALILEVGLYSIMARDFHEGAPSGLLWIFALWMAIGCAANSIRIATFTLRGPLRRLYVWYVRQRFAIHSSRMERSILRSRASLRAVK